MKIYTCFPGGKAKALTMSYDDGVFDDIRLIELFNKYGIKGTFNLNYGILTGKAGTGNRERIPREDILKTYEGHEIATHSFSHPTIARCPRPEIYDEIMEDRRGLEALTGRIIRGHAYPNGSVSEEVKGIFKSCDIAYGRVVETSHSFELPDDPLEWKGTCRHADPKLLELAEEFVNFQKKQYLRLMYVWGHSYEFSEVNSEDNNWEKIEKFCQLVGKRDDIWYATNIEIIDYMNAAKQIQYSADYTYCFNPTAISVWIAVDNDRYIELKPGQLTRF